MNIHDATECAYKNGYDTGVKEFAERLKNEVAHIPAWGRVAEKRINELLKEMTGNDNKRLTMPDDYHFEVGV